MIVTKFIRRRAGFIAGAALAYFMDPTHGPERRRRAVAAFENLRAMIADRQAALPSDPTDLDDLRQQFARRGVALLEHAVSPAADVICGNCGTASAPEAMRREWRHRLEGSTDPGAMATVSGLRCPQCKALGILTLPYGPQADGVEAEVLQRLPEPDTDHLDHALAAHRTPTERLASGARQCREVAVDVWKRVALAS